MNIGIGISLANYRPVPTVPLDPDAAIAALFESGEVGAWYDPSDSATVWQDAAGTTPATVGDPVGRIDDKSGNGNHATQSTSAARPVLQQSGDLYYLDFDGVDDFLRSAPTGWADTTEFLIASSANGLASTLNPVHVAGVSDGLGYSGIKDWVLLRANLSGSSTFTSADGVSAKTVSSSYNGTTTSVYFGYVNSAINYIRVNGSETSGAGASGLMSLTNSIDIAHLNISGSPIQISNIHLFGLIMRAVAPTAGQITDLETYLAAKSGVTL